MTNVLKISEAASLAMHTMAYLARHPHNTVSTHDIAKAYGISENHLAKVRQRLGKAGLVKATRGPGGGLRLARSSSEITLFQVYKAIEGTFEPTGCLLKKPACDGTHCILGSMIDSINTQVRDYLSQTTLDKLVQKEAKMAIRKIVKIDEEKCNGCGLCVPSCEEGAIQVIDGKARLVSDIYCDGLGNCLGECPQDAISIEEREAPDFDREAAISYVKHMKASAAPESPCSGGCPGSAMRVLHASAVSNSVNPTPSALGNWPVQLKLVPPTAPYFKGADILLVADCVPFAYADFHRNIIGGRPVIIGCPKLDDAAFYIEKLAEVLKVSGAKSLTVVHMEVPCCSGLIKIAQLAAERAGTEITLSDITITINGELVK
jgi:Rrf2 family protein